MTTLTAALCVSMVVASGGCQSLFYRDFKEGRYLNGVDATSDWERARRENVVNSANTATNPRSIVAATRGAEPYEVSSADAGTPESDSWLDNIFRWPSFSSKNKSELELGNELETSRRRETEVASRARLEQKKESVGFWGKVFPSRKADELDADSELLMSKRRSSAGFSKAFVKGDRTNKNPSDASSAFSRKQSSRAKSWNRSGIAVEQFQQTRFLPTMKTIERYYSKESVKIDKRLHRYSQSFAYGEVATRGVDEMPVSHRKTTTSSAVAQESTSLPIKMYRSNSYAPQNVEKVPADSTSDKLPESPATNRGYFGAHGSASLSPIAPNDHTSHGVTQTSVVTRASGLGKTRPIASTIESGVDASSYVESRLALPPMERSELKVESLFGWNTETARILEALNISYSNDPRVLAPITTTVERDVDESFRDSLGSKTAYDWFESRQGAEPSQLMPTPPDLGLKGDEKPIEQIAPETSAKEDDSAEDKNGELSVLDVDPRNMDSMKDVPWLGNESQESLHDEEIVDELDLDNIVDGAIARTDVSTIAPEVTQDVFANSTVSGGAIASDLADAIMESVDADALLDSDAESYNDKISALSEAAPETLDSRKTEQVAAPLTQEEIAWIEQVKNAIRSLLIEREEHRRRGDDVRICDARLRLLYLVIGEYERSIQSIQDESDPLRNFWEKECRGLETLLQNQLEEIDPTFVAERLRSGLDSLAGFCRMRVRKSLLVEEPAGYGLFDERAEPYEVGEELYAYSELDYVKSRETDEGFSIDVECRWRILASDGTPLTSFETQRCTNLSETKLRDVVLNVSVPLPEDLEPGVFLLELEVRDLNAAKPETCVERLTVRVVGDPLATGYFVPATFLQEESLC